MTKNPTRIVVLAGGVSTEATVSRNSAACVCDALRENFAHVDVLDCQPFDLPRRLMLTKPDVVFNLAHGGMGEDGTYAAVLSMLGIPFVGSEMAACALAMDKRTAKVHFRAAGLTVPDEIVCHRGGVLADVAARSAAAFPDGGVVKASSQGSAIGLSFCNVESQYVEALRHALSLGPTALVENRIVGRELTVALLQAPELQALPPVEILVPDGGHFDFYHRYTEGAAIHVCPAALDDPTRRRVEDAALRAHRSLGCRHYSRVDMLLTETGEVVVLEVNAVPGMTKTSLFPDAARAVGVSFDELVKRLVDTAMAGTLIDRASREWPRRAQ